MSTQLTLVDIPASEVDEVIGDFQSEGCSTKKIAQADGKFTVTAICPDGD